MAARPGLAGAARQWAIAIGAAGVLLVAAAAAAWYALRPAQVAQPHFIEVHANAYVLPQPDALAEFRLLRHDEKPFDNRSLSGRWSFLIFGYTFCPDFCPTTLAMFNEVHG